MKFVHVERFPAFPARALLMAVLLFAASLFYSSLAAQREGPLKLPSPPPSAPATQASRPADSRPGASSRISNEPPSIPVEEIIRQFAQHEAEFRTERENYTYTQTYVIQSIDFDGMSDGEYKLKSEIVFSSAGKRYEKITYAPTPTLQRISLSQQDLDDLEHVQPFVLTSEELPKYDIKYVGREDLDEVSTYAFDVGPKKIEKNQRYFQGRIWVEDRDFGIVKTFGKAVPDIKKGGNENIFPHFETFRENIEGHYWFPTYTRSDDVLHYTSGDVHIRMTVRYADYKRFNVTIKIGVPTEVKPDHP